MLIPPALCGTARPGSTARERSRHGQGGHRRRDHQTPHARAAPEHADRPRHGRLRQDVANDLCGALACTVGCFRVGVCVLSSLQPTSPAVPKHAPLSLTLTLERSRTLSRKQSLRLSTQVPGTADGGGVFGSAWWCATRRPRRCA